jgi:DNA polymerase type B, organellar and viral
VGDRRPIYAVDTETDPFLRERTPVAFSAGLFDGSDFYHSWGRNCIKKLGEKLARLKPGIIYIHNGGKFDLYVKDEEGECILDWLIREKKMTVINNRIVKAHIQAVKGVHELRDSMAIMPFALKQYDKDDIDYWKLEKQYRWEHRVEIVKYMRKDCVSLWQLCSGFWDRFGDNLTVGGTAMKEIQKMHEFTILSKDQDDEIRGRFYYGGRVQCFEKGNLNANKKRTFKVYDINQSYPNAMRNFDHPLGCVVSRDNKLDDQCFFLSVYGRSKGCFPVRTDTSIEFPVREGMFHITVHEYRVAVAHGLFELDYIQESFHFERFGRFETFVDTMHGSRKEAQLKDDKIGAIFYKYVGNSGYGKFAQDPDNYMDYALTDLEGNLYDLNYEPCEVMEHLGVIMWHRHSSGVTRYNVATGASITGAARAALIPALAHAKRPVYCDTDSIICEDLPTVEVDDTKLGAWKIEKTGTKLSIGGKKMYSLYGLPDHTIIGPQQCMKMASKGVRLHPSEIWRVADGEKIDFFKDAPTYDFKTRKDRYLHRTVKMT